MHAVQKGKLVEHEAALQAGEVRYRALYENIRDAIILTRLEDSAILAAILGVVHNLKIAVCACGVETAQQLDAVKEEECDSAQGHLLSFPLDTNEMHRLIETELTH